MNPLYSAAQDLVNAARNLVTELESLEDVPSAQHLAGIQQEINKCQQRLNSIQTETDTYTDLREAG
jgi:hypothetical protein